LKAGVSQAELEALVRKLKQSRGEVLLSAQQLALARQRLERGGSSEEWMRDVGPVVHAMAQNALTKNAIRRYIDRNLNGAFGVEDRVATQPSATTQPSAVEPQALSRRELGLKKRRAGLVKARAARSEKRRLAKLASEAS